MIKFIIKFIGYSILVYLISFILLFILAKIYDELIMVYAFFGIVYATIGGLILYFINRKFNFSNIKFLLIAILITVIAFLLSMLIVFNFF